MSATRTMGISVTDVATSSDGAALPLGFEYTEPASATDGYGEKTWVYVLADEVLAIGDVVEVNGDFAAPFHAIQGNEDTPQKRLLGVAGHAIASGSFGFVQKSGRAPYIKGDGLIAAGDALVAHTLGTADTLATDQGDMVFGYALAADAADSSATGHSVPVFAGMIKCGV